MSCILPDKVTAGLTFKPAPVTLTAYPAPDWSLTVILRGPEVINLAAVAAGKQHQLQADAAATAGWAPGLYWYSVRVTDGTDVHEVDSGQLEVLADLATGSAPHDGRSHAQRVLAAIEAVLEKRATRDQERYTINNRELWRTPIADLLALRNQYRAEVRAERRKAKGLPVFAQVRVRF